MIRRGLRELRYTGMERLRILLPPSRWLWLPLLVGIALRCWHVRAQVLADDEMHAVRAALSLPLVKALTTYRASDNCLPLTGYCRLLMDWGIEFSEIPVRLPILVGGFLILWLVPWWTARRLGLPAAVIVAWLLTISPVLVHYGRLVRSYTPIVLLAAVAAIAFERWLRTASRGSAALYVTAATLAAYFHLVSVPFVLSPFLFYAGARLARRDAVAPGWRSAILLGASTIAGFLIFMIPAWTSLIGLIAKKHRLPQVADHPWRALLGLQSGTHNMLLVALFWLVAASGWITLLREKPWLAAYTSVLIAGQIIGLFILSPVAMHLGPVFNRYLLVTLPFVLIYAAVGLGRPWQPGIGGARSVRLLLRAASVAFVVALLISGPVLDVRFRNSPFALRPDALLFFESRPETPFELPPAYRELDPDRPGRLVEYPWHTTSIYSESIDRYQRIHRRDVIVAPGERLFWDQRLAGFRNLVVPRPEAVLSTDAVYFLLHLDSATEAATFDRRPAAPGSSLAQDRAQRTDILGAFDEQAAASQKDFEAQWGPPSVTAGRILVWDLDRVRQDRSPR